MSLEFLMFEPAHLEPNELVHELFVRGIIGLSSSREETKALRNALTREFRDEEKPPGFQNLKPDNEINEAENVFRSLCEIADNAWKTKNVDQLKILKSRTAAWINRLKRIKETETPNYDSIFLNFCNLYERLVPEKLIFDIQQKNSLKSASNNKIYCEGAIGGLIVDERQRISLGNVQNNRTSLLGATTTPARSAMGRGAMRKTINQLDKSSVNHNQTSQDILSVNDRNNSREFERRFEEILRLGNNSPISDCNRTEPEMARTINVTQRYPRLHNWNLKFTGDNSGMSLNDFLIRVDVFAQSENIDNDQLLMNIHKLFPLNSKAYKWYWSNVSSFTDYNDFVRKIRLDFLPRNYDYFLKEEIDNRIQVDGETFSEFITDLKTLFQRANPPLDERYKLYVIQKNMQIDYVAHTATRNFNSVDELVELCRRFDESKIMLERRKLAQQYHGHMTFVEPSCHPQTNYNRNNSSRQRQPISRVSCVENLRCCDHTCSGNQETDRSDLQSIVCDNYQSNNSSSVNLVESNGERKSSAVKCFNCHKLGHRRQNCKQPQTRMYCYSCGRDGVISSNCPNCVSQSRNIRSSSSHSAQANEIGGSGNDGREEHSTGANALPN